MHNPYSEESSEVNRGGRDVFFLMFYIVKLTVLGCAHEFWKPSKIRTNPSRIRSLDCKLSIMALSLHNHPQYQGLYPYHCITCTTEPPPNHSTWKFSFSAVDSVGVHRAELLSHHIGCVGHCQLAHQLALIGVFLTLSSYHRSLFSELHIDVTSMLNKCSCSCTSS